METGQVLHGLGVDARGDVVASVVDSAGGPTFAIVVRVDDRRTEAAARRLALELLGRLGVDTAAAR